MRSERAGVGLALFPGNGCTGLGLGWEWVSEEAEETLSGILAMGSRQESGASCLRVCHLEGLASQLPRDKNSIWKPFVLQAAQGTEMGPLAT